MVPELPKIDRVEERIPKVRDVKAGPQTIMLEREELVVADVQEFTGPHLPDQRYDSDRTDAVALQPNQKRGEHRDDNGGQHRTSVRSGS